MVNIRSRPASAYRKSRSKSRYRGPKSKPKSIASRIEELKERLNANMPVLDELERDRAFKKRMLGVVAKFNGLPTKQQCHEYLDAELKYYQSIVEQFSLADEFYRLAGRSRRSLPFSEEESQQPKLMIQTRLAMLRIYEGLRNYLKGHSVFSFLKEYHAQSHKLNELARTEYSLPVTNA